MSNDQSDSELQATIAHLERALASACELIESYAPAMGLQTTAEAQVAFHMAKTEAPDAR